MDFGALYSPSLAERKTMARAIHAACAGPGFFYIVNHQFPQTVIERAQAAMQRFFALPVERKMRNHYPRLAQSPGLCAGGRDHGGSQS